MNELRTWKKSHNYQHGAFVVYTEDKKVRTTIRKEDRFFGEMVYEDSQGNQGWDLIVTKSGAKSPDNKLKGRLLAHCDEEAK